MIEQTFIQKVEKLLNHPIGDESVTSKSYFRSLLETLTMHHYQQCEIYRKIFQSREISPENFSNFTIDTFPFIPVALFKKFQLKSINEGEIYKTIYSSGTSNNGRSTILLDKQTSQLQQKALIRIVSEFTGLKRSPMLIFDKPQKPDNNQAHTSVKTAILGFSLFASEICYALDDNMQLQTAIIDDFLLKNKHRDIFIFGFTFQIWRSMVQDFNRLDYHPDLSNALLIHGGGWKKAEEQAVNNAVFRHALLESCRLKRIFNYYGMIEQTGNIFMECESGFLHCNNAGDVLIRNPRDFSICKINEPGIIQVISLLTLSYCGQSLLTSDEGILRGEDNCKCGRKGKYIEVTGRYEHVEPKGCSDV